MVSEKNTRRRVLTLCGPAQYVLLSKGYQPRQTIGFNLKKVQRCPIQLARPNVSPVRPGKRYHRTGLKLLVLQSVHRIDLPGSDVCEYPSGYFGTPFAGRWKVDVFNNKVRVKIVLRVH